MSYAGIDQSLFFKAYPAIAVNAALFLYAIVARPKLRAYLILFSATTLMDILVAAKFIPVGDAYAQTALEYIFVLVGDLRFILLLAFLLYGKKTLADLDRFRVTADVVKPAFVFTLFPTLLVTAVGFAKPDLLTEGRPKFLAYELIFFALTTLWIFVVLPQRQLAAAENRFLRAAAMPVFVFYGLWSLSDILILRGIDQGYLLRIVPNLTYYCLFLPWVAHKALRAE